MAVLLEVTMGTMGGHEGNAPHAADLACYPPRSIMSEILGQRNHLRIESEREQVEGQRQPTYGLRSADTEGNLIDQLQYLRRRYHYSGRRTKQKQTSKYPERLSDPIFQNEAN